MTKKLLSALLVFVMIFSLAACGSSDNGDGGNTEGDVITIKFAGTVADTHPITKAEYKFAELLKEYSGGTMVVENYPNGQMGSNREIYESMQNGTIQIAEAGAVILANFTDKFKFTSLPYLFNSSAAFQAFLKSDMGVQMVQDISDECGFKILGAMENGWQAVTNSKHEIKTVDDMKGLKIRTQENDILLEVYKELLCSPTPMAFTELFTGMQQGTVDGQVNPILIAYTQNYDEVQKYCTDVNAVYDVASIAINTDFYNGLTDEQRGWLDQAMNDAIKYNLELSVDAAQEAIDNLNLEFHWLTDAERQTVKDATAGVYDWFRANVNEPNLDKYLATIDEINEMDKAGKLDSITGEIIG